MGVAFYSRFMVFVILALLAGCTTDPVFLRHPQTGKNVQCGPYYYISDAVPYTVAVRKKGCIEDYQRQGYERVME